MNSKKNKLHAIFWRHVDDVLYAKNWTYKQLASESGLSYATLAGWKTRDRNPDLDGAFAISEALGVTLDSLLEGSQKEEISPEVLSLIEALNKADPTTLALIKLALKTK